MGKDARNNPLSFQRPELPVEAVDMFGRRLTNGDRIMLPELSGSCVWRIEGIRPVLEPGAPANLVAVRIVSVTELTSVRGTPIPQIVLVVPHQPEGLNDNTPGDPAPPSGLVTP